ncbi:MAG: antitoxin [Acidobacteriia bacterium]|nr:antitoxin [Terriglobia bacterium]
MRTTLSLEDDVFQAVKTYAENRSLGMGKAVSDLLRKGLTVRTPTRIVNGLVVFDLPPGSPAVTTEQVKNIELELDESELK